MTDRTKDMLIGGLVLGGIGAIAYASYKAGKSTVKKEVTTHQDSVCSDKKQQVFNIINEIIDNKIIPIIKQKINS